MYHGSIKMWSFNVAHCFIIIIFFLLKRNKHLIKTITDILRILRLYYIPPRLNKQNERKTERRP